MIYLGIDVKYINIKNNRRYSRLMNIVMGFQKIHISELMSLESEFQNLLADN